MEVAPSPKAQEKVGVPVQFEGVAVAAKFTASGAVPELGEAEAVQAREQVGKSPTWIMLEWEALMPPVETVTDQE